MAKAGDMTPCCTELVGSNPPGTKRVGGTSIWQLLACVTKPKTRESPVYVDRA